MQKFRGLAAIVFLSIYSTSVNAVPLMSSFFFPQSSYSADNSLGYAFSSDTGGTVTALGFWDFFRNGFSNSHQVGLWDDGGALLGLVDLAAGDSNPLIDGFRYASLERAVELSAGASYFLAGTTLRDNWVFQASDIEMTAGVNYLGSYFSTGPKDGLARFPDQIAAEREYMTVNALISATSVPVPGTIALLGLGLLGFHLSRRRADYCSACRHKKAPKHYVLRLSRNMAPHRGRI